MGCAAEMIRLGITDDEFAMLKFAVDRYADQCQYTVDHLVGPNEEMRFYRDELRAAEALSLKILEKKHRLDGLRGDVEQE